MQKMKVQLHCICRLPEGGEEEMAYCPSCHMWYHKSCKSIPDIVFQDSITNWHAQSVLYSTNITCTYSANILLLSVLFLYTVYFYHFMYKMDNYNGHAQVMVQLYLYLEIIIH